MVYDVVLIVFNLIRFEIASCWDKFISFKIFACLVRRESFLYTYTYINSNSTSLYEEAC